MAAKYTEYYVQLINKRTKAPIDDDSGKYIVLTASSPVPSPIYSNDQGTVISYTYAGIAQTMTNGIIQFWTTSSVTTVDLSIVTAAGQAVFVEALTPSQHRVEIDTENPYQTMIFPYYTTISGVTMTASDWTPGFSIPAQTIVRDCYARVFATGTAASIGVGVSGTPTGFLQAMTGDVTGFKYYKGMDQVASATATWSQGSLLYATTTAMMKVAYLASAATAIVFTNVTSTTLDQGSGWVYITYELLPT